MNREYDIIIVGAGPGGATAAYHASKAGAKVLLIDKRKEIGVPVRCGEAVIESVLKDQDITPDPNWVTNVVRRMDIWSSNGRKLHLRPSFCGYMLERIGFEKMLVERAREQGAELLLQSTAIGLNKNILKVYDHKSNNDKTFKGKILIGADGVESRLGRWAGLNTALPLKDIAVCAQYVMDDIELEADTLELYWGERYAPGGYAWVFPKSERRANVGVMLPGNRSLDAFDVLDRFIGIRALDAKKAGKIVGAIPQSNVLNPAVKNNVILVGDAARLAFPVTGGGIGNAMISGRCAGQIAGKIIVENLPMDCLEEYDRFLQHRFSKRISRAHRFKDKLISNELDIEALFIILKPFVWMHKMFPKLAEKYILKDLRY